MSSLHSSTGSRDNYSLLRFAFFAGHCLASSRQKPLCLDELSKVDAPCLASKECCIRCEDMTLLFAYYVDCGERYLSIKWGDAPLDLPHEASECDGRSVVCHLSCVLYGDCAFGNDLLPMEVSGDLLKPDSCLV